MKELRKKIETEMNRKSGKLTKELKLIRQGRNIAYGNVLEWIEKSGTKKEIEQYCINKMCGFCTIYKQCSISDNNCEKRLT
jgi:hypothetical protein